MSTSFCKDVLLTMTQCRTYSLWLRFMKWLTNIFNMYCMISDVLKKMFETWVTETPLLYYVWKLCIYLQLYNWTQIPCFAKTFFFSLGLKIMYINFKKLYSNLFYVAYLVVQSMQHVPLDLILYFHLNMFHFL